MAKKKAATQSDEPRPVVAYKRGAPQKQCPSCGTLTHARTAKCPKCEHVFTAKDKTRKIKLKAPKKGMGKGRAAASLNGNGSGVSLIQAAAQFIRAAGSVDAAQATLAALKELP